MKFTSLTYRFVLWFIVVTLLPLTSLGYLTLQQYQAALQSEAQDRLTRLADKKTLEIKTYLFEREQNAQLFARGKLVGEAMSSLSDVYLRHGPDSAKYHSAARQFDGYFNTYIDEHRLFYDVFLITPQGEIIYTNKHESDFTTNLINGPYRSSQLAQVFRESRITLESNISDFEIYAPSSAPAAFVAAPIIRDGTLKGVLAFQLNTERVYQVARDSVGLGLTGETALAKQVDSEQGIFVAPLDSDPQAAFKRKINLKTTTLPMRHALLGERGAGMGIDYRGREVVAAWRYLPELNWGMVVKMDADEIFTPLYQRQGTLLEALLALTLFAGVVAFYFGRRLVVPLKSFALTADEIAKGDLGKRVDETRADEIGMLGRTFNRMTGNLQTLYRTLEDRVEERTRELNVSNEQLQEEIIEREHIEKALLESKMLFSTTFDLAAVGIAHVAPDGRWLNVNQKLCDIVGYAREELLARTFQDITHPDDLEIDLGYVHKMLAGEISTYSIEKRYLLKSGGIVWCNLSVALVHRADGSPDYFISVVEDITERRQLEEALKSSEAVFRELFENMSSAVAVYEAVDNGEDFIFRNFNRSGELTENLKREQLIGKRLTEVFPGVKEFGLFAVLQRVWQTGQPEQFPSTFYHDNRIAGWRENFVYRLPSNEVVAIYDDVTKRKQAEEQLRIAAATFETREAILITDANANILRVNQAFQDITGYSSEEVLGKNPRILSSGRQDTAFYAAMWRQLLDTGSWTGEMWDKRKSGQIYPKWLTITAVKNERGETSEYVAIFSDITARKQAEEEIRNLAFYDVLTKLPNRRLLLDHLRLALSMSARSNHYGALLFLDMDKFKTLNDTLGHDYGDLMLSEVAKRIQLCVREVDTVARLGGDEFVVLIEEISVNAEETLQKVALVAEKIRASLSAPYQLKGHEYHSSPSIGVCLYRGNEEPMDVLLKHADLAMYQAKDAGRNAIRFFDPAMQHAVEMHAALEADLRHAVPDKQLRLYYQIQLDNNHRPLGAEALVRWVHPKRGLVSPAQFIPIAEESSLILDIGHWVLETACRQLALWGKREQTRHLEIAVNVSAQQFRLQSFVDTVEAMLRIHKVNPARLKLELTESVILTDVSDVVAKMHALKALGIKLSMDDFGTGYSSLSYLKQLPLDQIKIDQSFVRDIATDPNDAVMVQTIINLAQNFRLNVIAEGVETRAQLDFLKLHGCMAYQGYLFSKPVSIDEFEVLLGKD